MKEQTLSKLNAMKLSGMSRSFRSTFGSEQFNQYTHDEFIAMLVDGNPTGNCILTQS